MFLQSKLQNISEELSGNLQAIYSKNEAGSITKLLLENLGYSPLDLITKKSQKLPQDQIEYLEQAFERLMNHEPVQYLLGKVDFYGLKILVTPAVLIPRQETEELVDMILKENHISNPKILDIGTGSGCIALGLKSNIPGAKVDALDNSLEALDLAIKNSKILDLNVHFHHIDIMHEALLPGEYDIIVSNPPYVTEDEKIEIEGNVLEHEPLDALFVPEEAPLVFYECIIELAARHLHSKGKLFFEINEKFGGEVETLLHEARFNKVRIIKDLNGKDRIACGIWSVKT